MLKKIISKLDFQKNEEISYKNANFVEISKKNGDKLLGGFSLSFSFNDTIAPSDGANNCLGANCTNGCGVGGQNSGCNGTAGCFPNTNNYSCG